MSKARTLADLISDNAELADGQISVAEVVGAAPTANPTFTGTATGTFSGPLTGNVTGDLTGDVNTTLIASPTLNATVNIKTTDANGEGIGLGIDADKKVRFYDDQGSSTKMYWNASTVTQKFEDNSKLAFGSSENLKLYHDGTNKLVGDLTQTGAFTTDKYNNAEALPTVRPSLLLDFANSKTLDPRITFTRGSTATYWDGHTTTKAEENLITSSENITSTNFVTASVSLTRDQTAPDGTTTATLVQATTTSTNSGFYRYLALGSGYTFSIYAKAGNVDYLGVTLDSSSLTRAVFNLSTGTVESSNQCTASMVSVGNGWYRCILANATGNVDYVIVTVEETNNPVPWGSGSTTAGSNISVWGLQLEQRSSATAYTPTTSSPIVKYQPTLQTAASGEARFDHDPVTGESKGLLIEEARTNTVTNSVVTSAGDINGISFEANAAVALDGTVSAALITSDSTNDGHYAYYREFLRTSGVATTISIFVKPLSMSRGYIFLGSGSGSIPNNIVVDTSDWTVTYSNGTASSVTEVGNGWYRLSTTGTATSTGNAQIYVGFAKDSTTTTGDYVGDLSDRMLLWGFQAEAGSFPTSYIPTSGSTVTRAVEQVTMSNIASELNGQEGTLYIEATPPDYTVGDQRLISIGSSHSSVVEMFREYSSTNFFFAIRHAGTTISQGSTAWTADTTAKAVIGYKSGDIGFAADGSLIMTNTGTFAGMEMNQMLIGRTFQGGASAWSGEIKKIAYYPQRLSNATLQAMTEE